MQENLYATLALAFMMTLVATAEAQQTQSGANLNSQLFDAVKRTCNISRINRLLAALADPNAKDNDHGATPLHYAVLNGCLSGVNALLAADADPNAKADDGEWTPLHVAAVKNARDVAAELIERGADVHATDHREWTPLHRAADNDAREVAIELIERGADVHAKDEDGETPLHHAARYGHIEAIAALLAAGANPNAKDTFARTPLSDATSNGHVEAIAALMAATEARMARMDVGNLRDVLEREISANTTDENGWTDLHWAVALNLPELAVALPDAGVEVDARLNVKNAPIGQLTERLNSFGLYWRIAGRETPLHIAAQANASDVAYLLIVRGANIHAATGKTEMAGRH